jgi:hypothetical protein
MLLDLLTEEKITGLPVLTTYEYKLLPVSGPTLNFHITRAQKRNKLKMSLKTL